MPGTSLAALHPPLIRARPPPAPAGPVCACALRHHAGEAPVFRIIESGGGGLASFALFAARQRTMTLKAGGIEECMDWAIAVREAIAACVG